MEVDWNVDCHPWDKNWLENGLIFSETLSEEAELYIGLKRTIIFIVY